MGRCEATPENAAAFLARLVAEFPQKIDAVTTDIRPAFAHLREAFGEDMRARARVLTPSRSPAARRGSSTNGRFCSLENPFQPKRLELTPQESDSLRSASPINPVANPIWSAGYTIWRHLTLTHQRHPAATKRTPAALCCAWPKTKAILCCCVGGPSHAPRVGLCFLAGVSPVRRMTRFLIQKFETCLIDRRAAVPPSTTHPSNPRDPAGVTLRGTPVAAYGATSRRGRRGSLSCCLASSPASLKMTSLYSSPGLRRAASWFNTHGSRWTT